MRNLQRLYRPWVIGVLVAWSLCMVVFSMFNGSSVGSLGCAHDPNGCADGGLPQQVAWAVGCIVILSLAYATRPKDPQT